VIVFVRGQPRSGKSLFAEKLAEAVSSTPTYVGTLPSIRYYEPILEAHRQRRGSHWQLLELKYDIERDRHTLADAITTREVVLLDGVSYYLFRLDTLGLLEARVHLGVRSLVALAAASSSTVIVVDAPPSSRLGPHLCRTVRRVHAAIASAAGSCFVVENAVARRVAEKDVPHPHSGLQTHGQLPNPLG
jgi:adenosyl cobinamide kinase/adenosyl cobinamide phosphate guanylyltransferase